MLVLILAIVTHIAAEELILAAMPEVQMNPAFRAFW
jgi:hypothetical protein